MRNKPRFHVHGSAFKLKSSHRSMTNESEEDRRGTKSKMEKRRIRKRLEQMKGDDVE